MTSLMLPDDDHLARRVAHRRQLGEFGQQAFAPLLRFHQQHVGRARGAEHLHRRGHAAHLDIHMGPAMRRSAAAARITRAVFSLSQNAAMLMCGIMVITGAGPGALAWP
jgi:hypothetical protein